mgnify:CR=1 FL=1
MKNAENIRIALASPLYGGNIGSVCRVMANTGLHDLAIAAPRDNVDLQEARNMACSAWHIYEQHREFPTLSEAVADCGLVIGTTARLGLYRSHSLTPRAIVPRILEAAATSRVALVFGREDWGLSNEELAICTQLIQIPSDPGYLSLNVAQAVMICCYELYVGSGEFVPSQEKTPEAPSQLRERMFAMWQETLLAIGFMKDDKADHMMLGLRRILGRGTLTVDDVKILMGMARQTRWMSRQVPGAAIPADHAGEHADAGQSPNPVEPHISG